MTWRDDLTERLSQQPCCGYGSGDRPATEPSALVALALTQCHELQAADQVGRWLAEIQSADGSVGVREQEPEPCWPTSLAMLVWQAISLRQSSGVYADPIRRAIHWTVTHQGRRLERLEPRGHDTTINAWSWVQETHAWIEPTALFVLALCATGQAQHDRTREAARMILDRQLPHGGWNYGNTFVLGNELRPHLQPTGLALLALAALGTGAEPVRRSLDYLANTVRPGTATASLCWSLLGLSVYGRRPAVANQWLEKAYERCCRESGAAWKFALLALTDAADESLLVKLPRGDACQTI